MDRTQVALCVQMIFPLNGKGRGGIEEGASEALSELVGCLGNSCRWPWRSQLLYFLPFQFMITGGSLQDSKDALQLAHTNGTLFLLLPKQNVN